MEEGSTSPSPPPRAPAPPQQHFLDLCELLGQPKPAAADPEGAWYTFERGVHKTGGGEGWADVWMKGHFAWEYKRKRRSLVEAYQQLLRYRETKKKMSAAGLWSMTALMESSISRKTCLQYHSAGRHHRAEQSQAQRSPWKTTSPQRLPRVREGRPEELPPRGGNRPNCGDIYDLAGGRQVFADCQHQRDREK